MGDLDRDATLTVHLENQAAIDRANKFNDAMRNTGKESQAAASATSVAVQSLNSKFAALGLRYQQTGIIQSRSLAAAGVELNNLTREYGKTAHAADRLTVAERAFLTAAQSAHREAISRAREYNDELQKVNRQTRDFTSLHGALQSLPGVWGQIAKGVTGVFAALTSGLAIGRQLDQWLTENIAGWKDWKDKVAASIVGAFMGLKDLDTKGLLTPLTPKGEATQFAVNLESAAASHGVKTLGALNNELEKFNDKVTASRLAGKSLGAIFEENKSQVEGLVAGFRSYGKSLPLLESIVSGWEAQRKAIDETAKSLKKAAEDAEEYEKRMAALQKALHGGGRLLDMLPRQRLGVFAAEIVSQEVLDRVAAQKRLDARANAQFDAAASAKRNAEWKKVNDDILDRWDRALDDFASDMADVFTAGVIGGAEGFAEAASRLFLLSVNDGAKTIFKTAARIAFGAPPDRGDFTAGPLGQEQYNRALTESTDQSAKLMGVFQGAVGALGQTLSMLQNAKKGQEVSVLGSTLSFAAAGASIGALFTPLGAAIGAVVGAIAGMTIALIANAKALKSMPYAQYGIKDGKPYVEPFAGKEGNFANVTAAMYNDMISQMTHTMEDTRNDYIKLLLKFPNEIASSITAANFAPTMAQYKDVSRGFWHMFFRAIFPLEGLASSYLTGGAGARAGGIGGVDTRGELVGQGQIGNPIYDKNALRTFNQDFQNWVNNTLPKEIIATFEAPLMKGFQALRLTAERFHEIWDRLQAIDPKDAIKSLNDLYDALSAFQTIQANRGKRIYGGAGFEFTGGWIDDAMARRSKSFADQLAQADAGLVSMGASLELLIGPEQITQAKAWGDALLQREQALKQFFDQVALAIDNVIHGYQASIRDLELAGFKTAAGEPDVGGQVGYLKQYADQLYQQIQHAPTIEAATALSAELQKTILQIQAIGGSQSVEAAEAYRLWAIEQLKSAQALVVTRLQELAQAVADQNEAFLDAIQKFIDAFLGAAAQLTPTGETPPGETPATNTGGDNTDRWNPRNPRRNGGEEVGSGAVLQFQRAASAAARNTQSETDREIVRLMREQVTIMREGREFRNVVVLEVDGQQTVVDDGFERRGIQARGR